jgi:hypothetical protein
MDCQKDIENIFNLKTILEEEVYDIDEKELYQYVLKDKSLGFLFSYIRILVEKEIGNYSEDNKIKIINYLFTSIFKNLEQILKMNVFDKCLKLFLKKNPNFMLGYNSCESQKVFISTSQDYFYFWKFYINKSVKKIKLNN